MQVVMSEIGDRMSDFRLTVTRIYPISRQKVRVRAHSIQTTTQMQATRCQPPTAHRQPPTAFAPRPPPPATAHRSPPTAHRSPPTAHRHPLTAHCPPPTANRSPPLGQKPIQHRFQPLLNRELPDQFAPVMVALDQTGAVICHHHIPADGSVAGMP